ncbi:E3 ubiquitin/ISG15 ligase TRIM25-like [Aquarana catesbeiana]|uniref:E3 ubiquitin/ISG15 ligase TRIM25-like n=1 Tax=Aquarana catesbeiana TaxID=8400 RepID=UPI003CC95796
MADQFHPKEPKVDNADKFCTYCVNSPVPAVTLCLHCEAFLCEVHKQTHSKSPEHVLTDPTTSLEDRKCPVHKKIVEYYCTVDRFCICLHCLTSDHNGHRVSTMSEYLQQKTENMKPILEKLSSKVEKTEATLQSLQDQERKVQETASGITEKVSAILRDIKRQLEDLEKRVMIEISRWQQDILSPVSNHIQQLENKKTQLLKKILQIETLGKNTILSFALEPPDVFLDVSDDDNDLLSGASGKTIYDVGDLKQDEILETLYSGLSNIVTGVEKKVSLKDILKPLPSAAHDNVSVRNGNATSKSNVVLEVGRDKNVSFPAAYHNANLENSNVSNDSQTKAKVLEYEKSTQAQTETTTAKTLDVTFISGNQNTTLKVLLDVNTASNYLLISDDLKTVSRSDVYLGRPETPERFQSPQVLSTRGISSGKHVLEMEVSNIEQRSGDSLFIGMGYASIDRRGSQALTGDNNNTWGIWINDIHHSVIKNNRIKWLASPFSKRKKIDLDYEAGRLSFYDLCDPIEHLHTFTTTFTQPLHLLISIQAEKPKLYSPNISRLRLGSPSIYTGVTHPNEQRVIFVLTDLNLHFQRKSL